MADVYASWVMRTCPICKKEFLPAGQHGWKIGDSPSYEEPVCSYTCQRKWEKNRKKAPKHNPYGFGMAKAVRIVETGEKFRTITECAKHLGVSSSVVSYCLHHGKVYKGMHIEKVK